MVKPPKQKWKSRREIPDPLVKDAADQYENARKLLAAQPPMSGVLMPMMNLAAVAIELYLKCLCAEQIHAPESGNTEMAQVHAKPPTGHRLTDLFAKIPRRLRDDLDRSLSAGGSFRERLDRLSDSFMRTRYPYEYDADAGDLPYPELMEISSKLSEYVASLQTSESIDW